MADQDRNFCVKCDENLNQSSSEKTLKCNSNTCNKGLHYTCSSYNTSELQFLESNKDNVKWFCDGCKNHSVKYLKIDLQTQSSKIDDLIMLEDSTRGTLCAIHKTIHSTDNFPCTKHKMLKLCPVPKPIGAPNTKIPISRSRRKSRSNSPCFERPTMYCSQSANEPYRRYCCTRPHIYCKMERSKTVSPELRSPRHANVEKTISCPEKMCCYNSKSKSNANTSFTITSRSSVKIDQFAQNLINTDEVVNELKGEIERVKHQLHHISQQKLSGSIGSKIPCPIKTSRLNSQDREETEMTKLKNENKKLKREIEAKKKLLEKSKSEVTKAKDILTDYEKKVNLLHIQALKSSKAMKISKDKFCNCLRERDDKIKTLKKSNVVLERAMEEKKSVLNDKERDAQIMNETIDTLRKAFDETCEKCSMLTETNQNFMASIDMLRSQLLNSSSEMDCQKETIDTLEQKVRDLNCICKKIALRTKRKKESYMSLIKNNEEEQTKMSRQISELSAKLEEAELQKNYLEDLQCQCREYQEKLRDYETFFHKCKNLEDECQKQHEKLVHSETTFQRDKQEMEKLIEDLTTVVKQNKVTLLHMTEINKQQENVIKSQSMALLTKEEQLMLIEKESRDFKAKNQYLEQEVQELRNSLSGPCSKDACLCISNELTEIKNALNVEKDTHLLKEKIIQDQSQTILNLQSQVKDKMSELNRAQSDTKYLEEEIGKINEKLIKKHQELDLEIDEKESLIEKLRILECQKNQLSEEISDFEDMLRRFKNTCGDNKKQQRILKNLEEQITEQRREWESQKEVMAKEKQKAVCAAKFATQKLLDTVEDFQRQVDAQKKVQLLLTKMLHEKDEQLRIVKSKISNINNITKDTTGVGETGMIMKELFKSNTMEQGASSDPNTNTSLYSSCSSCCKRPESEAKRTKMCNACDTSSYKSCLAPCANVHEIIKFLSDSLQNIQEEPSRDFNLNS